ncbi:MAG TPA: MFS transporter [Pirellulales bacterium]|nr:MFS transporter [Pirellulales bacterium]
MSIVPERPWYRELNSYHWFVFVVAALGWLFDTMDQQLFNLARRPACTDLLGLPPSDPHIDKYGGYATSIFLIGWATGGIVFGVLGDRIGRAKTMLWTILIYSLCTGLSAFSQSIWDFSAYRFLTGLGVGGEFAVGVALVAEVMPDRARPFALGLLQALSAVGNIAAALISLSLGRLEETGALETFFAERFGLTAVSAWRVMFVVGTVPALLAIFIRRKLKEPERWQATAAEGAVAKKLGSYAELFGNPRWRSHALLGLAMAFCGVVGLWAIGFYSIDLTRLVFRKTFESEARQNGEGALDQSFLGLLLSDPAKLADVRDKIQPASLLSPEAGTRDAERLYGAAVELFQSGETITPEAVLGLLDGGNAIKKLSPQTKEERLRREAYLRSATPSTDGVATHVNRIQQRTRDINGRLTRWAAITSVMLNLGAFCGIYAFSRVTHWLGRRPTFAISFFLAAASTAFVFWNFQTITDVFWMIPIMGFCQLSLFGGYAIYFPELFPTHLRSTGTSFCYNVGRLVAAAGPSALGLLTSEVFGHKNEPMRYAGVTMCSVFLLGLLVLPFVPETKGKPLPE